MPQYRVNRRYAASWNGTRLHYAAGVEVDLPEDLADWVNRDSPGTLALVEPEPEPVAAPAPAGEPEPASDQGGEDAAAVDDEAPRRNRQHKPRRTRA